MKKKGPGRFGDKERLAALETSIYNVYWVWSMVAYIILGNLKEAHQLMQNTALKMTEQERLARKSVMKVFTDITRDPSNHVDLFLESAYCFEAGHDPSFGLTRKLLNNLRRRKLLPAEQCDQWERRLAKNPI